MNQEIQIFKKLLDLRKGFFESNGYIFEEETLYNEYTPQEFPIFIFENKNINKRISFSFDSSVRRITKNQITVSITKKNCVSISLSTFLAYKNLKKTIKNRDTRNYRFKVDPQNLEETINQQLDRIIEILSTDMKELFTTEAWMDIPQVHPFDE